MWESNFIFFLSFLFLLLCGCFYHLVIVVLIFILRTKIPSPSFFFWVFGFTSNLWSFRLLHSQSTPCNYPRVITLCVQPFSLLYVPRPVVCVLDRLTSVPFPQAVFLLSFPLCYVSPVTFSVFPLPKVCLALFICDGLNDSVPIDHTCESWAISWWQCVGGFRKDSLAGGSVSLGQALRFQSHLSLLPTATPTPFVV